LFSFAQLERPIIYNHIHYLSTGKIDYELLMSLSNYIT